MAGLIDGNNINNLNIITVIWRQHSCCMFMNMLKRDAMTAKEKKLKWRLNEMVMRIETEWSWLREYNEVVYWLDWERMTKWNEAINSGKESDSTKRYLRLIGCIKTEFIDWMVMKSINKFEWSGENNKNLSQHFNQSRIVERIEWNWL